MRIFHFYVSERVHINERKRTIFSLLKPTKKIIATNIDEGKKSHRVERTKRCSRSVKKKEMEIIYANGVFFSWSLCSGKNHGSEWERMKIRPQLKNVKKTREFFFIPYFVKATYECVYASILTSDSAKWKFLKALINFFCSSLPHSSICRFFFFLEQL